MKLIILLEEIKIYYIPWVRPSKESRENIRRTSYFQKKKRPKFLKRWIKTPQEMLLNWQQCISITQTNFKKKQNGLWTFKVWSRVELLTIRSRNKTIGFLTESMITPNFLRAQTFWKVKRIAKKYSEAIKRTMIPSEISILWILLLTLSTHQTYLNSLKMMSLPILTKKKAK